MIASAPDGRLNELSLVRVALAVVSSGQELPAQLADYLNKTIREASDLLRHPTQSGEVSADAVRLAVELRKAGDLSDYLDELSDPEHLSQALARDLLEVVEQKFAHFG